MYCIGYLPISLILRTAVWFSLSLQYALNGCKMDFGILGIPWNKRYEFSL